MSTEKPQVFLALPIYDGTVLARAAAAFFSWPSTREHLDLVQSMFGCSLLARTFNTLWIQALNHAERGLITHFAMLHADVAAPQFWLDTLMEELTAREADICSVVVPIKDMKGVTSTAIDDPANPWQPYRRLTMTEVMRLPETFTAEDCHQASLNPHHGALLVNTGCWVCDLRRPWWLGDPTQNQPLCFMINDRIRRGAEGKFFVDTQSEDWYFSREAAKYGAKIIATRKVKLEHFGEAGFSNVGAWGEWSHDMETLGPVPPERQGVVEPESQPEPAADSGDDGRPKKTETVPLAEGA
jgi:hypothetical protein